MFRHDVLRYVYVALRIDCGWDVEIEGEGEKERTSLRLNIIIYEPRKKLKKNQNCASLTRVLAADPG